MHSTGLGSVQKKGLAAGAVWSSGESQPILLACWSFKGSSCLQGLLGGPETKDKEITEVRKEAGSLAMQGQ